MARATASRTVTRAAQPKDRLRAAAAAEADAFMAGLSHPLKADIERVRAAVLRASPIIADGVKWNSLSFRTTEWFATLNRREARRVQLVMHLGAKVKDGSRAVTIADPRALLKWLSKDRCLLTLPEGAVTAATLRDVTAIVRQWIAYVR